MFEPIYKTLITQIDAGNECLLLTDLHYNNTKSGVIENKILLTKKMLDTPSLAIDKMLCDKARLAIDTGKLQIIPLKENHAMLIEPFIPNPRLIIFGGGHIAKPLVDYAAHVGFNIIVVDDRLAFANTTRFPNAKQVICESFEDSFSQIDFRPSDFIVIITRGHRYDGTVLREVLKHHFHYVGMIGSKRRVKGMMAELLHEGIPQDKLDAVHSPIGLDIGAITPDEIAISIVAELISFKNKSLVLPEFDKETAQKTSEASDIPRALITILSSKGSVPRKAGAKMLAYLDGRSIGSIGGGCSESEILTKARAVMGSQNFLIEQVDMTNEVAESEGMVCGGVMHVLIEGFCE
ncbi:XdhC family protein [Cellulosilyticum sp. I15G10I2]|uniref:XdhC family protein n=1 Tax=Cellulosilyticum sp. I15G10I2 TaxID=1892843 RepID=UPI00085C598B|nr:XdhC family protein [Cellulosilyticum sp. I15G10I2]